MAEPFPDSLCAPDPAAGHKLAIRLAAQVEPALGDSSDMASLLRNGAAPPGTRTLIVAIYFHAIAVANGGWREPRKA